MNKNVDRSRIEEIEKLMKEPSPLEATLYEERIRRNLLLASAIVFASIFLEVVPSQDSKLFGFSFENLTLEAIYIILLVVISYEFIHYFWLQFNKISYWRVRLTATNQATVRGSSAFRFSNKNDPSDHNGTSENSNFYVWMFESKEKIHNILNNSDEKWQEINLFASNIKNIEPNKADQLSKKLDELMKQQEEINQHINNIRLDASMHRFDNWYSMMIRSQSLRWLILDFILPILSGAIAIIILTIQICP